MNHSQRPRTKIFISYSHKDAHWLDRLRVHLRPLEREELIDIWDDTLIAPGKNWRDEIEQALASAKVAVLLVSADFLASDFIVTNELPRLLVAAEKDDAVVLPVIISPSQFLEIDNLSRFQAVNDPKKPLSLMSRAKSEATLAQIAQKISDLIKVSPDFSGHEKSSTIETGYAEKIIHTAGTSTVQQRKQVTILFGDILGITEISETRDAEQATDLINELWQCIDAEIVTHGGMVNKHMDNIVIGLWGIEETREDDPERAIRAALDMQNKLVAFTPTQGIKLTMRIGISTGSVVWGAVGTIGEFSVVGDTVNQADQLKCSAPVGGVLVSHETYRHVRGVFDVSAQDPTMIKGRSHPIQTYWVHKAKPRAFRVPMRGVEGIETRTVGRDAELLILQNTFRDVMKGSETRIVTIVGDAGVGKSRLLYEFENWIDLLPEQIYFFKGRGTPEIRTSPYGIIRDMFALRFEIFESDNKDTVVHKFRKGMADILTPDQADLVGHLVGFDFSASQAVQNLLGSLSFKQLATSYLINYIRAVAREPIVIFLEDIHWADDSSLDFLDSLLMKIPSAQLLVLCLARHLLLERRPNWGEGREAHTRLELKPLSRQATRALIDEILQNVVHMPDNLPKLIVEQAEGNPYYVEELIKMMIEDGVILRGEDQWSIVSNRLAQVQVPPTLTSVLQARLDSLPWEEKILLQRASVVGRLFWDAAVSTLHAEHDQALKLSSTLDAVRTRELVFRHEQSTFAGVVEYAFQHALLRDVTYETVLLKLRKVYHQQVAQWLEKVGGERVSEFAGLIADHYEQAGEVEKAVQWLQRAGQAALETCVYREAIAMFQRALALLANQNSAERARLLVKIGKAFIPLGQYATAREHLEAGLELARLGNDHRTAAEALGGLSLTFHEQGAFDKARPLAGEALTLARLAKDKRLEARNLRQLGDIALYQGDYEESIHRHSESLTLCRELGDRKGIAASLNSLGNIARDQGDWTTATRHYKESLAISREIGDRHAIAIRLNNLANVATSQGDHAAAVPLYTESLTIAREINDPRGTYIALANLAYVCQQQGDYSSSMQYGQEALAICREIKDRFGIAACFDTLGFTAIMAGDDDQARRYFREALQGAAEIGMLAIALDALAGLAQLSTKAGHLLQAAEWIGLALNHPSSTSDVARSAEHVVDMLRTMLPSAELDAGLEQGKTLDIKQIARQIASESD